MQLANLRECPEAIPTLATWHHAQWSELNPHKTMEMRIAALQKHLGPEAIPVTFVAVEDGQPLGSASLVERDLATHTHLGPWLASVYVTHERRRQGIGGQLVRRVVEEAARLHFDRLYLFTLDQEPFYRELGWERLERNHFRGHPIVVMSIAPQQAAS